MSSTISTILQKAVDGSRLTFDEGVALFDCSDLPALGRAADAVCRRLHPEPYRTYNIDRNINYTNVCAAVCDFCAFYRKSGDADAYVLPREELYKKIEETIALGGDQILMQGGHPSQPQARMVRGAAARSEGSAFRRSTCTPSVRRKSGTSTRSTSCRSWKCCGRLKDAGMGSLPGGGGEILVDRVRKAMTVNKCLTDEWLEVHRVWHGSAAARPAP